MEWSRFNYLFFLSKLEIHLLYNSLTNVLIELDKNSHDKLNKYIEDPSLLSKENSKESKILINGKFFIESDLVEINKIKVNNNIARYDNSTLSLSIAPTRHCNFNCFYCYEEDRKNIYMDIDTEKSITGLLRLIAYIQMNVITVFYFLHVGEDAQIKGLN